MHSQKLTQAVVLAALAGAAVSLHAASVSYTIISVSGDQAPGLEPGVTFDFFDLVRTDGAGHVLYQADLAGDGIDELNDGSIWSDRSGSLSLLLREGDEAPFDNLVLYTSLTSPAFNASGSTAFGAALDIKGGPEETTVGLFSEDATFFLTPFALDGATQDDIVTTGLVPSAFNDQGSSAYIATEGAGLWVSGSDGSIMLIASAGDQLDGMPVGTEVKHISAPAFADDGRYAFRASFAEPENDGPELSDGLWTGADGSVSALAAEGMQAPGYADGVIFADVSQDPSISTSAGVAFFARVAGDGIDAANDGALWAGMPGSVATFAREGDQAPGLGAGIVFSSLPGQLAFVGDGAAAFVGQVSGGDVTSESNSGIWTGPASSLTLLAREGDAAPGAPGFTYGSFDSPAMTDSGYVAFSASLRPAKETYGDNYALYLVSPEGEITLVALEGRPFEIGGEEKTISDLAFDSRTDGRSSLADDGSIYFKLYFEDRSQALVMASEGCPGDYNGDGVLNVLDFVAFQLGWTAQEPAADCDGNGDFNIVDFVCFQLLFAEGCE